MTTTSVTVQPTHNDKGVAVIPLTIGSDVGAIKVMVAQIITGPGPNNYFPVQGKNNKYIEYIKYE